MQCPGARPERNDAWTAGLHDLQGSDNAECTEPALVMDIIAWATVQNSPCKVMISVVNVHALRVLSKLKIDKGACAFLS